MLTHKHIALVTVHLPAVGLPVGKKITLTVPNEKADVSQTSHARCQVPAMTVSIGDQVQREVYSDISSSMQQVLKIQFRKGRLWEKASEMLLYCCTVLGIPKQL